MTLRTTAGRRATPRRPPTARRVLHAGVSQHTGLPFGTVVMAVGVLVVVASAARHPS